MSASWVSRICPSLSESVADLQERDLTDVTYPYIRLDATYIKCRGAGHVQSTAPFTAIGTGSGGYRRLLGLDAIDAEPYNGWRAFPLSPRARGVDGEICVTCDAHEGLKCDPGGLPGRRAAALHRADLELRRRSSVVQVLPGRRSPIGMMGVVFSEMAGDWAGRRRFGDGPIGKAAEGAKANEPARTYEGTAAEHAARIIALVAADNPISGRQAA